MSPEEMNKLARIFLDKREYASEEEWDAWLESREIKKLGSRGDWDRAGNMLFHDPGKAPFKGYLVVPKDVAWKLLFLEIT